MRGPRRAQAPGFTLLELLVALAVLALVVAGLAQGTGFGLRAAARQETQAAARGDLDAVDRLLRRLVEQAVPGTMREPTLLRGQAAAVAFTTDLGSGAGALASGLADIRLAAEDGRLVLRWSPVRRGLRTGLSAPPQSQLILDGVDRLELSYWGAIGEQPPAWHGAWQEKLLPRLVRLRLVFTAASRRRWPDIVAAPAAFLPTS